MLLLLGRYIDVDGTEKFVFENQKGIIEITWVKNRDYRNTLCLPTHYYCSLGCKFCHITGINRGMDPITVSEMTEAVDYVLKETGINDKILFSFMGVGEPLLNHSMICDFYLKFKHHGVSTAVSTMLPNDSAMVSFSSLIIKHRVPVKLHVSLHSTNNTIRSQLVPLSKCKANECFIIADRYFSWINQNYDLISIINEYHSIKGSPVEIHYTLIEGVNDSDDELSLFKYYMEKHSNIPIKMIQFNPIGELSPSSRLSYWMEELNKIGTVRHYCPPGPNIGSSCGQFTKHYYMDKEALESKEFKDWHQKYCTSDFK